MLLDRKKLVYRGVIGVIVFSTLLLMFWIFMSISKPHVIIKITGDHSPIKNQIVVDGWVLEPLGDGGKEYKKSLNKGDYTATLSGAFIQKKSVDFSLGFFETKTIEFATEAKSSEQIIRDTLGDQNVKLSNIRTSDDAILFYATGAAKLNTNLEDYYAGFIVFNQDSKTWRLPSSEGASASEKLTQDELEYLNEMYDE